MKKTSKHVPGSRTLMPIIVEVLQNHGGTLSSFQVVCAIMFKYDLPPKLLKKARKEVGFSGVYLRKIGALLLDSPKGIWSLQKEYLDMDTSMLKNTTYEKYDALYVKK